MLFSPFRSSSGYLYFSLFLIYSAAPLWMLSNTQESHPVSNWLDGISSVEGSEFFRRDQSRYPSKSHRDRDLACPACICTHCSGNWFSITLSSTCQLQRLREEENLYRSLRIHGCIPVVLFV